MVSCCINTHWSVSVLKLLLFFWNFYYHRCALFDTLFKDCTMKCLRCVVDYILCGWFILNWQSYWLYTVVWMPTFHMFPWIESIYVNEVLRYKIKHELSELGHAFILTLISNLVNIYSRLNMLARCKWVLLLCWFLVQPLLHPTQTPKSRPLPRSFFAPQRFEFHAPKVRFVVQEDWAKRPCPAKSKAKLWLCNNNQIPCFWSVTPSLQWQLNKNYTKSELASRKNGNLCKRN